MLTGWPVGENCETGAGHVSASGSGGGTGVGLAGPSPHALAASTTARTTPARATGKKMRRPKIWYRLTVAFPAAAALEPERRSRIGRHRDDDDVRALLDRRSAAVGRIAAV